MAQEKTLATVKSYSLESPSEVVKMALVLKTHIVKHKLYTTIREKNYVHVEGWQFAGGMLGLVPQVVDVENVSDTKNIRYKAKVNIVNLKTNQIVSTGFAICSNLESKKRTFDEYAIMSMAQTRAIGKAYRNIIGWVMKLAGYEGTPSEEMKKMGETHDEETVQPTQTQEAVRYECNVCGDPLTEAEAGYSKKMYGKYLCRTHQKEAKAKRK